MYETSLETLKFREKSAIDRLSLAVRRRDVMVECHSYDADVMATLEKREAELKQATRSREQGETRTAVPVKTAVQIKAPEPVKIITPAAAEPVKVPDIPVIAAPVQVAVAPVQAAAPPADHSAFIAALAAKDCLMADARKRRAEAHQK